MADGKGEEVREVIHNHTYRVDGKLYEDLVGNISDLMKQGARFLSSMGDYFASRAQELDMKLALENSHDVVSLQKEFLKSKLRADRREQDQLFRNGPALKTVQDEPKAAVVGPVDAKTRPVNKAGHMDRRHHHQQQKPISNPVMSPADVPLEFTKSEVR